MDDLINRQAAIDTIDEVTWYHQNKNGEMVSGANSDEHQAWYKADDIYKALKAVPSAERRGRWLEHKDYPGLAYLCSECNLFTTDRSFYCPNCGAKMDEVKQ